MDNKTTQHHNNWYQLLFRHTTVFMDVFYTAVAVIMLAVLSNISIPLQPVPITLQTFGVFLVAFFFGSRKGAITILAWILVALAGFGVFAGYSSGLQLFFKAGSFAPTGGYILGFLAAVYVVGRLIEKGYGRTVKSVLLCVLAGNVIIYVFGLPWLWLAFPEQNILTILEWGLTPFLIGDTLKMLAAVGLFPLIWKAGSKVRN